MIAQVEIIQTDWQQSEHPLRRIRAEVFMAEQSVPEALEWDGEDGEAIHLLALGDNGEAVGCARILHDGHIGRMAVLKPWRRMGIGRRLLRRAIEVVAALGCPQAFLDAQTHAIPFYEREGFRASGAEFLDAGIPHRHMSLELHPAP